MFPDLPQDGEDDRDGDAPAKKTRRRSRTSRSQVSENGSGPSNNKGKERAPLLLASQEWELDESSSAVSNDSEESSVTFRVFDEDAEETASDISDSSSQQQVEDLILQVRSGPFPQDSIIPDACLSLQGSDVQVSDVQSDVQGSDAPPQEAQISFHVHSEDQAPQPSRSVTPTQGMYQSTTPRVEYAPLQVIHLLPCGYNSLTISLFDIASLCSNHRCRARHKLTSQARKTIGPHSLHAALHQHKKGIRTPPLTLNVHR